MLRLCYLETNLQVLTLIWVVLSHKLFDSEGVQDVFVIFGLMIGTKLVAHNDGTLCFVSQAPLKIEWVESITLKVVNSIVKLLVIKHNIELL